jgi:hypothetical protein
MQRSDGSNFTTWGQVHISGRVTAMASDGTRVFVLGGNSKGARVDEISLIHVFDTSMYVRLVIYLDSLSS